MNSILNQVSKINDSLLTKKQNGKTTLCTRINSVFFLGCQRTSTDEINPQTTTSTVISSDKNVRSGGDITTKDVTPVTWKGQGTVQFQWGANNQFMVSEPWRAEERYLTVAEKLAILKRAYDKIGIIQGTAQNKIDFKCTYDKAVTLIQNSGTINYGYRSNNYVYQCCPACGDRIEGKNVNKARCDFAIARGGF